VRTGLFLTRGQPKSLFRPGSSTDVLIFQRGRTRFADDLVANMFRPAASRFSHGFGRSLLETDVHVRSLLAWGTRRGG
jgi:phosphatidylserine decarboxylase